MSLIKSILLGSAAGIVAVAGAQAADLPTKKAAPVAQYVKICNVGGITGWTLPGSDTCLKISGYMTAQYTGGNLNTQYNWGNVGQLTSLSLPVGGIPTPVTVTSPLYASVGGTQRVLVQASQAQNNTTFNRNEAGYSIRASLVFDFASNTAYGPLLGHIGIQDDLGNGFDNLTSSNTTYCDQCYLTWAGITAGKAASFFSFVGGGDNWANFLSPDQKGFNEPILLAYTASFGGGFSATIAAQSPGTNGTSGGGTDIAGAVGPGTSITNTTYGGQKWPDIVGQLHVKQGWGEAQLSGVIHNVNVQATGLTGAAALDGCGIAAIALVNCNSQETKTGWAIDAGVKINLPSFGQDDNFLITGAYGQSAVWYTGMGPGEMMWGEGGQVNGNGQPMYLADAFFNSLTNQWSTPRSWSVTGLLEHHFTPQFYIDLEGSVGQIKWSNDGGGCNFALAGCLIGQAIQGPISPSATTWIIGADLGWNPVTNLNFDLELMYQDTNQTKPSGFLGTVYNLGGPGGAVFVPGAWEGNSSGFAGRFRITRYF
jgi:hypothetical protein